VTLEATDNYGVVSAAATASVTVAANPVEEEALKKQHEQEEAERALQEQAEREHEEALRREAQEKAASEKAQAEQEERTAVQRREEQREREQAEEAARRAAQLSLTSTTPASQPSPLTSNLGEVQAYHAVKPAPAPDARLDGTTLRVSRSGVASVKIACPAGVTRCRGTITLRALGAVVASHSIFGSQAFSISGGATRTVGVRLSSHASAMLAAARSLRARAKIASRDGAGVVHSASWTVTLRARAA
jgi:hypothetical protein